jgi:hypothetical protein
MSFGFPGTVIDERTDKKGTGRRNQDGQIPRLAGNGRYDAIGSPEEVLEKFYHEFEKDGCKTCHKAHQNSKQSQADVLTKITVFKVEFHLIPNKILKGLSLT